jgi:hypothetical protein
LTINTFTFQFFVHYLPQKISIFNNDIGIPLLSGFFHVDSSKIPRVVMNSATEGHPVLLVIFALGMTAPLSTYRSRGDHVPTLRSHQGMSFFLGGRGFPLPNAFNQNVHSIMLT